MKLNFVSAFTVNTPYEEEVKKLKESLIEFGFSTDHIVPIKNLGTWEKNCAQKARVIKDKLRELNEPIIWIDADAVIEKQPIIFNQIEEDLAVCYYRRQMCSGIIFIKPTQKMFEMLDEWINLCDTNPTKLDQDLLDLAIKNKKIKYFNLPTSYCKVDFFDAEEVVIVQNQASRKFKNIINNIKPVKNEPKMDPYSTHQKALVETIMAVPGNFIELGCGYYSTPIIRAITKSRGDKFTIAVSDIKWGNKFKDECDEILTVRSWNEFELDKDYAIALLDNEQLTKDRYLHLPKLLNRCKAVIIHDADRYVNFQNWEYYINNYRHVWYKDHMPNTIVFFSS